MEVEKGVETEVEDQDKEGAEDKEVEEDKEEEEDKEVEEDKEEAEAKVGKAVERVAAKFREADQDQEAVKE